MSQASIPELPEFTSQAGPQPPFPQRQSASAVFRVLLTPLLLFVGVQLWLVVMDGRWGRNSQVEWLPIAILLALVPPLRRAIWRWLRPLRRPTPLTRRCVALLVALATAAGLTRADLHSGRDLFPTMHDEFQFLLQAQMLAHGWLWMPAHPLPEFFDTFYVLITPLYAPQSFPGTAIFYVPAIWLHLPPWTISVTLCALVAAMLYRVATELVDGLAGLLAAALFAYLPMTEYVSIKVLAQTPAVLLGLGVVWAYLHWRRRGRVGWLVVLGFLVGWLVITRPVDALVLTLPVAIGLIVDHVGRASARRPPPGEYRNGVLKHALQHALLLLMGASPMLALQAIFNLGVTGHLLRTPFALYNDRDQPQLHYGFTPANDTRPPMTAVPEKRDFYARAVLTRIHAHHWGTLWDELARERLPESCLFTSPQPLLFVLTPLGLWAARRRRRWLLAAPFVLFFILYAPYPLFDLHYSATIAPAGAALAVLGVAGLADAWPRARAACWVALLLYTAGLLWTKPEPIEPLLVEEVLPNAVLGEANRQLARLPYFPAIVMFRRDPKLVGDVEPVYTLDAPWPDDAPVMRVHDLGPHDAVLFAYYARLSPGRAVYRFDEARPHAPVQYLGTVAQLAAATAAPAGAAPAPLP